ncbi:DUF4124 domain-containing protein [Ramlibacter sp. G-1-2-2]|uniref:DUF4124 domain-containing protein n=2 Tax=Ramlibacter agri TaxID=2728837 RepID=A0A848GVT2_9BURK|nr:DUF4124 domain-containing protein [Ramlibacter agri]
MKVPLRMLTAVLFLACANSQGAELYACRDGGGRPSYQQLPCSELQQDAAPPVAPVAAKPAAAVPSQALTRRKREVLDLTVMLQRCRSDQPGFAERSEAVLVAWKKRYAQTLAEQRSQLASQLREAKRITISPQFCTDDLLRKMEPLTVMPDTRLDSVEKTWGLFLAALKAGDRLTAEHCLTGKAEARWKQRAEQLSDEDLRRYAEGIRGFKVRWGDDYMKEALAADDSHVAGVVFENLNEEWRISDL